MKMLAVIGVGELADHDPTARASVYEASVLEVNAGMGGLSPFLDVEEDQVAFFELPLSTEMSIASLVDGIHFPGKVFAVNLAIDFADEA